MGAMSGTTADCWNPLDLLERARAAADPQSVWAILQEEVSRAGFGQSLFAFGVPRNSTRPILDKLKRGVFQGAGGFATSVFTELAKRPHLLATEPVAPHCKRSLTPFVWSQAELKAGAESALGLGREIGLTSFVVFPLRSADASCYGNFTVFCTDPSHESWLRHAKHLAPLLHITAHYFHDSLAGCNGRPEAPELALSPRQRECLLWASRGLSTKQIAERLKLSEPVVHEYLTGAKRKLGCATRAQAVARAVTLDLIVP